MDVLITGADGFIGQNLFHRLKNCEQLNVHKFTKKNKIADLNDLVLNSNFIFHLAATIKHKNNSEYNRVNKTLTKTIIDIIKKSGKKIPILFTSSTQINETNIYGKSKKAAEQELIEFKESSENAEVYIYRLPNVFGKWAKPNYNSAVATFCHNVAKNIPTKIFNPSKKLKLLYIDDLIKSFLRILKYKQTRPQDNSNIYMNIFPTITPIYTIEVQKLFTTIKSFENNFEANIVGNTSKGLPRKLYATYLSYIPKEKFSYTLTKHSDLRGDFVEVLKTKNSGQFSFFTLMPNLTRGNHYHNTKNEKFLVLCGKAMFKFKNISTNDYYEIKTSSETSTVIRAVPGWSHSITNIGEEKLVVLLWTNEVLDVKNPDTHHLEVSDR